MFGFTQDDLMIPLLKIIYEKGGEVRWQEHKREIIARLARQFHVSNSDLNEIYDSTGQTKFETWIRWARKKLVERGLLSKTSPHGVWELTSQGRKLMQREPGARS